MWRLGMIFLLCGIGMLGYMSSAISSSGQQLDSAAASGVDSSDNEQSQSEEGSSEKIEMQIEEKTMLSAADMNSQACPQVLQDSSLSNQFRHPSEDPQQSSSSFHSGSKQKENKGVTVNSDGMPERDRSSYGSKKEKNTWYDDQHGNHVDIVDNHANDSKNYQIDPESGIYDLPDKGPVAEAALNAIGDIDEDNLLKFLALFQNRRFSYGYASSRGKRSSMEDFCENEIRSVDGQTVGLFGVFDGHGGARAAEYVKQNLFDNLVRHPNFFTDTMAAIADAYNHTDAEFLKADNNQHRDAGSTASTAIIVGDRLLVANVGDSRAVICRNGTAVAVSRDHKPDQVDERQRIEDAGGFVMWAGTWRVGGVLAVSRAFGDRLLKQFVVADPEIKEVVIDGSLQFLILASDGLWDVVSNEEAVSIIQPIEDAEVAAKRLTREAIQRGSGDNVTCIVVRFHRDGGAGSAA